MLILLFIWLFQAIKLLKFKLKGIFMIVNSDISSVFKALTMPFVSAYHMYHSRVCLRLE
jgi:hypothetical protein